MCRWKLARPRTSVWGSAVGLRTRKNYEENRESVWSSSNFFRARHIFIFNAAVSNNVRDENSNQTPAGITKKVRMRKDLPIVGLCTMIKT
jgi:hypothetical protein